MTTIRVATEADAEEILAIYAKYIEQTAITKIPDICCRKIIFLSGGAFTEM